MRQMVVGFLICGIILIGYLAFIGIRRVVTGRSEKQDPWIPR